MKICLIFPPVSDPRGPHLAPAALAASLRQEGHTVTVKDIDLEMALYLLSPEILDEHKHKATEMFKSLDIYGADADWRTLAWKQKLSQQLHNVTDIIPRIPEYINVLRTQSFYDPTKYFSARMAIDKALALITSTYDYDLTYKMDGQIFSTRFKEYQLTELLKAVEDHEGNLFHLFYNRKTVPEILLKAPELVGISILNYQQIIPGLSLAKKLREAGLWVVVGGTVYTKFVESLSRSPDFFTLCHAVVVYEGESSLSALVKALKKNKTTPDLSKVPNLIWYDGISVRVNRPFYVQDISNLPTPDFSGFPLDQYLAPRTVLPYNLGKGCYWNRCRFCEIPLIHNLPESHYRVKPAQLIVDQIEELSNHFNTPYFQFTDESCSPALLEEIADIIIRRKLTVYYLCYARLDSQFTIPCLKKLRLSGLRKLMFGLESGSDRVLNEIRKGITASQAETVLNNCKKTRVYFRLFVILGLPGETFEDAWETRNFLRRISPLLSDPLNNFEINPFHLDTFSIYGQNPEKFNITLPKNPEGEFFLGGAQFACPDSMDKRTLHRFISETRKEMYQLTHMASKHSGWEEYSLLNICNYEKMDQ